MGHAAQQPSQAVGRLLRRRRKELRLTLQDVSRTLGAKGQLIPISTLARIERGELDPGVPRLHQLLRLYGIRPHLVTDLMDMEALAVEPPATKDIKTLFNDGLKYWEQGNTAQGLAHLFAVREYVPDDEASRVIRQKATFVFAGFARTLGKFELAHQLLDDLLREPPDSTILFNVLLLSADVWRGLGSLPAAFAFQHQAEVAADPASSRQRSWATHQKGRLLTAAKRPDEAESALHLAISAYRELGDSSGETKAMLALSEALTAAERHTEARETATRALERSEAMGHALLALSARTKIGLGLVASGEFENGVETLTDALSRAMLLKDHHGQFLAHYHLWKVFTVTGEVERANLELESARYFVRFVDEASSEADEIRSIPDNGGNHGESKGVRPLGRD